jgi:hypothetical protein
MYALIHQEKTESQKESLGGYNSLPPNWAEITEKEFSQSNFFSYTPEFVEFRQAPLDGTFTGIHLFHFFDGTGVALTRDYWKGTVRYFKFAACEHSLVELSGEDCRAAGIHHAGNCYHVYRCTKCGFVQSMDSSG